jgi:hypothetical protein
MVRMQRLPAAAAVIVCLVGCPLSDVLLASDNGPGARDALPSLVASPQSASRPDTFWSVDVSSVEPLGASAATSAGPSPEMHLRSTFDEYRALAQRGRYRGRRGRWGNGAAEAALVIGTLASITGGALLVYANRPECSSTDRHAAGCGYGTRVVGGAVLAGGVISLAVGALTWRR